MGPVPAKRQSSVGLITRKDARTGHNKFRGMGCPFLSTVSPSTRLIILLTTCSLLFTSEIAVGCVRGRAGWYIARSHRSESLDWRLTPVNTGTYIWHTCLCTYS